MVEEGRLSARSIKQAAHLNSMQSSRRAQRSTGERGTPSRRQSANRSSVPATFGFLLLTRVELIAAELDGQDAALIRVAAYTGLRPGELRAARWSDVDWLLRIVHVRRSYTGTVEGPPKSGKVRSICWPDQGCSGS